MGHISKEVLDKINENQMLKEGVHYHLVHIKKGKFIPPGWIYRHSLRRFFNQQMVIQLLAQVAAGHRHANKGEVSQYPGALYLYEGPRPNKKWGQVCP